MPILMYVSDVLHLFVDFFPLYLLIALFEHNSLSKILIIFVLCDLAGHSNQRR